MVWPENQSFAHDPRLNSSVLKHRFRIRKRLRIIAVADPERRMALCIGGFKGSLGTHVHSRFDFFHFHTVFGKNLGKIIGFWPKLGNWRLFSLGNPGSAIALFSHNPTPICFLGPQYQTVRTKETNSHQICWDGREIGLKSFRRCFCCPFSVYINVHDFATEM